jgi:hypothetical protein
MGIVVRLLYGLGCPTLFRTTTHNGFKSTRNRKKSTNEALVNSLGCCLNHAMMKKEENQGKICLIDLREIVVIAFSQSHKTT